MIKIGVVGIAGRMGSLIAKGVIDTNDMSLAGALEMKGHAFVGKNSGYALGTESQEIEVCSDMNDAFCACDVIIDFTMPEVTMETLEYAVNAGKALVIGTTGLDDEQVAGIKDASSDIPLVLAPNMSIGVNVMFKVAGILTRLLGDAYDIEIIEAHHRLKKDAPSGTALGLARSIAESREVDLAEHACYERHGIIGARPDGQIGIQTLRAGDIVGDHTVLFAGNGERVEITHRAHSRQNFAQGAIKAARWLHGKKSGFYTMMDVLGLEDEDR